MNEQKKHQLQQNALHWFENQFLKTPEECGMKAVIPRVQSICFIRSFQVVFAKESNTVKFFIKGQKILERVVTFVMINISLMLFSVLFLGYFLMQHKMMEAGIIVVISLFLGLFSVIALAIGYQKVKPLQKLYNHKVIVYSENG